MISTLAANRLQDEPSAFLERRRQRASVTPTMPAMSDAERLGIKRLVVDLDHQDDTPDWV